MTKIIAQVPTELPGTINAIGPLSDPGSTAPSLLARVLSSAIGLITAIAFIWFLFLLITGAVALMSAGGDKVAIENARRRITTGLIGLVVVIGATFILDLIASILGIPRILNIDYWVSVLSPP